MIQAFDGLTPQIHETAWVHEGAWVMGDVHLGALVSVWPTAVLRGDMGGIRIGEKSNLQDGVICHDTTNLSETIVGARVTVGHRAVLHGCIIEDDCLIGMGAIVMDNARIGAGSLVGAGSVVPTRVQIPPGSLVLGAPAKVVRPMTRADRRLIEFGWKSYVGKVQLWLAREGRAP